MQPHRQQPTRLHHPWDSPGKNTGVGCHFLLQCMKVKSESEVAQSCPTVATPWTAAYQAPPSIGFSRQEYWRGLPLPSPELMINILNSERWKISMPKNLNEIHTAAAAAAKSLHSFPTLCDPIDGSPPGSPVPGILQARTLEWVAISLSDAWKWKVKVKSLSRVQL